MDARPQTISVHINGEPRAVPTGQPLTGMIADLGLSPQTVLVEHNGHALLRDEWPGVSLTEGDTLEILRVVAGG